ALLAMLASGRSVWPSPWSEIAQLLAITKFLLILTGLSYVVVGALHLQETQDFLKIARTVRFSLGLSILLPLVVLSLAQTLDSLRVLAEDVGEHRAAVLWFYGATLSFAGASWYWARVLVYLLEPDAIASPLS